MEHFYRVRALVDSAAEEEFCLAGSPNAAMEKFEKVAAKDTGDPFGAYAIDVAMVHKVTFGEAGPMFEDVTHHLNAEQWARADYGQCLRFFNNA